MVLFTISPFLRNVRAGGLYTDLYQTQVDSPAIEAPAADAS